jgi:RHS repeat-associated protein
VNLMRIYTVHDVTGNIMAIYHHTDDTLRLIEKPIYGSSRLGIVKQNMTFLNGGILFKRDTFSVGLKNYELTDHLGNVTVTFLDRKYGNFPYITSSSDYYPFGFPMPDRGENLAVYRFGFNGQEADNEVYGDKASYAFEFRNYDARLGRWWGIDLLWQKYPGLSPYLFCSNNPLNRTDMTGMLDDWVQRTVDGVTEIYYDRDVQSQADVDEKYGANSGVTHLKDGTKVGNGQYAVYNDHVNNKNGVVKDANGNVVNNDRTILYGSNYTIFAGITDNSVNAETLHQNLFESSYIGPNNPQTYKENDSYDYQPTWSPTEMAALRHDKSYDAKNARGIWGAISRRTKCADLELIYDCNQIINNPNTSIFEKNRAQKMKTGFSTIVFLFKTPHY